VTQFHFTNESDIANHFIGHTKRVTSLFLMNKNILVTGSYDATIRTWNIQVNFYVISDWRGGSSV
jgi:WD40 repeat protein